MKVEVVAGWAALTLAILAVVIPVIAPLPHLGVSCLIEELMRVGKPWVWGGKPVLEDSLKVSSFNLSGISVEVCCEASRLRIVPSSSSVVYSVKAYGASSRDAVLKREVKGDIMAIRIEGRALNLIIEVNEKLLEGLSLQVKSSSVVLRLEEAGYPLRLSVESSFLKADVSHAPGGRLVALVDSSFASIGILYPESEGYRLSVKATDSFVDLGGELDESLSEGSLLEGEGEIDLRIEVKSSFVKISIRGR